MSLTLSEFLAAARIRFNLSPLAQGTSAALSNAELASRASGVLLYWGREGIKTTEGKTRPQNGGLFLKSVECDINDDGFLRLPKDVGIFVGAMPAPVDLRDFDEVQKIASQCDGEFVRYPPAALWYTTLRAGTRHVVYNSNLSGIWGGGTVASFTDTTMTPNAAPAFTSVPIIRAPGFYDRFVLRFTRDSLVQERWVKSWDGTTFTFYGDGWDFAPLADDAWGVVCPLDYVELLLQTFGQRTPQAESYKEPGMMKASKDETEQFHATITSYHGYER